MPKFLVQASYTTDGTRGLLREGGTGRRAVVEDVAAQLNGRVESLYFAFGDTDLFAIMEFPDNVSMAAVALTVKGTGMIDSTVTVLLEPEEIDLAVKTPVRFRAPGAD
jgi:uncharacterized protein with GYD domain